MVKNRVALAGLTVLALCPFWVRADGLVIDKVYHPYVDAMETELELRSVFQDEQTAFTNKAQVHQFAIGKALNDTVFAELYMIGGKDRAKGFQIEAYELEFKWQLTEQGEYWADYGMMFEFETQVHNQIKEATVGFLAEKELGAWSATANLFLISEWGDDIRDEFESTLALQLRYRLKNSLEPAIEIYTGQTSSGIGPAIQGTFSTGLRKSLHWEAGLMFGVGSKSPGRTMRFMLEYEF